MINHQYILERMAFNLNCPFHVFDKDGTILLQCGVGKMEGNPFRSDFRLYDYIKEETRLQIYPMLIFEDNVFIYGAFFDSEGKLYVGGPVSNEALNKALLYQYRKKHNIENLQFELVKKSLMEIANSMAILFYIITDIEITEEQILNFSENKEIDVTEWDKLKYHLDKSENSFEYMDYGTEIKILDNIRAGNTDAFIETNTEKMNMIHKIGKLANSNMKQWEYMAVTAIALATRAAIDGGIHSLDAYHMSDLYLQKLERCQNIHEIMRLIPKMQLEFTEKVYQVKSQKKSASYIEQCKNIIGQNINNEITVEEIAEKIGINRSYLSRKFAEQVGISISRYIIMVRLEAAENMLKYSDLSIQQISEYLNFSSQSYFGSMFKEKNGVTPSMYRKMNHLIDF